MPRVPRDLALRNTVRNQSPNQSPILHRDPIQSVWVGLVSTVAMASFSVADTCRQGARARQHGPLVDRSPPVPQPVRERSVITRLIVSGWGSSTARPDNRRSARSAITAPRPRPSALSASSAPEHTRSVSRVRAAFRTDDLDHGTLHRQIGLSIRRRPARRPPSSGCGPGVRPPPPPRRALPQPAAAPAICRGVMVRGRSGRPTRPSVSPGRRGASTSSRNSPGSPLVADTITDAACSQSGPLRSARIVWGHLVGEHHGHPTEGIPT